MSDPKQHANYRTFILMIASSAVLMFALTYVSTYEFDHVRFSRTRLYMNLMMTGAMALVMLFFMRHMYRDARKNALIVAAGVALIGAGAWMTRAQASIGDAAWMKAMIPHHSIAILTSTRADLRDPRVRALADSIVETQRREIDEMEALIDSLEGGTPSPAREASDDADTRATGDLAATRAADRG